MSTEMASIGLTSKPKPKINTTAIPSAMPSRGDAESRLPHSRAIKNPAIANNSVKDQPPKITGAMTKGNKMRAERTRCSKPSNLAGVSDISPARLSVGIAGC